MKILVERLWKKDKYTIGKVYVNGEFFSNSLEDKDRGLTSDMPLEKIQKLKVKGETAIPTGTYEVDYTMSSRFKKMMPLVKNVKGFDGIRIHSGNTAKDTLGCLLLGKNTEVGKVTNSKAYCDKFYKLIEQAIKNKEKITITYK